MKRWGAQLLLVVLACAGTTAHALAPPATPPDGTGFDALYARLTGLDSYARTFESIMGEMPRLKALLPPGDAVRAVRYEALYCNDDHWFGAPDAMSHVDVQIALAQRLHEPAAQVRLQTCRALYLDTAGLSRAAVLELDKALPLAIRTGDPLLLGDLHSARAAELSIVGEQAKALLAYRAATAVLSKAGASDALPQLLLGTAITYRRMGDFAKATELLRQLQPQIDAAKDWERAEGYYMQLGYLHLEAGRPEEARRALQHAVEIAAVGNHPLELETARVALAEAYAEDGQPEPALALLALVDRTLAGSDRAFDKGSAAMARGEALAALHRHREALVQFERAQRLMAADDNPRYLSELFRLKSLSEEALGNAGRALADYRRYVALHASIDDRMLVQQQQLVRLESQALRQRRENRQLRSEQEALLRVRRWQLGALVLGGLLVLALVALVVQQRQRSRRMRQMVITDPLTGIASRLHIYDRARQALAEAGRTGKPLAALVADVDHFKQINDCCGHPAGDAVLVRVAQICKGALRQQDLIGRTGGEEFLVICPESTPEAALHIAERLRHAVEAARFDDICSDLRVTLSVGIAQLRLAHDDLDKVIERADTALYRAKSAGRNRVELAEQVERAEVAEFA